MTIGSDSIGRSINNLKLPGDLAVGGAFALSRKFSGAFDMDSAGVVILAVTATPRTVTLLTSDIIVPNRIFIIQDETGTAGDLGMQITVDTEGAQTINGAANVGLTSDFGNLILYTNGANLFILNQR
jgi:hypothetical protein